MLSGIGVSLGPGLVLGEGENGLNEVAPDPILDLKLHRRRIFRWLRAQPYLPSPTCLALTLTL